MRPNRQCTQDLIQLASLELGLQLLNDPAGPPTWVSNNSAAPPGVLNLVWVDPDMGQYDKLRVHLHDRTQSDHAILAWDMPISPNANPTPRILRRSAAADEYIRDLGAALAAFPTSFESRDEVATTAHQLQCVLNDTWERHASIPKKTKFSKSWWNQQCTQAAQRTKDHRRNASALRADLRSVRNSANPNASDIEDIQRAIALEDSAAASSARDLKYRARRARRQLFTSIIEETEPEDIWNLVQWTKPRRLDATTTILKEDGSPALTLHELQTTFQNQFTPNRPRNPDISLLDEIPQAPAREFPLISLTELQESLATTSNSSAPGPDHLPWYWIKHLLARFPAIGAFLVSLYNACIRFGIHPTIFKWSVTVIIPKPNKTDYSQPKAYRPIVLLSCLGKLFEKIIARRMQFDAQKHGILHPCQFGGTTLHSTTDAGVQLVHNIRQAWNQGLDTTALLLDVSQFFPSIHHSFMTAILRKQGFAPELCSFFDDYLVGRTTQFLYNGCLMEPAEFTVGVGQGSALSPVLSGLYVAPVLHKCAPINQASSANACVQFFVDDGLISVAAPPLSDRDQPLRRLEINNAIVAHIFHTLAGDLQRLGLGVEPDKLELMHFTRSPAHTFPPDLPYGPDLAVRVNGVITRIRPKPVMRYLGFFLDPKLTFRAHIKHYTNKASSSVNALRMLGNSVRGLSPVYRRRLYLSNIIPLALYGAQLWWHPAWRKIGWIARELQKVQARACRWITGCFRTTPVGSMELLAKLIPIRPQVNRHMQRAALRLTTLHESHPLRASLPEYWRSSALNIVAPFLLHASPERPLYASPLRHADWIARQCNESFDPFNAECQPGNRIRDTHRDRIIMHLQAPKKASKDFRDWKKNVFAPKLEDVLSRNNAVALFTDGSHKDDGRTQKSGAAWAIYLGRHCARRGRFAYGKATPYDAEMAALARGIHEAVSHFPEQATELHIFVDNRAAANTIFSCNGGPGQLVSIMACKKA